MRLLLQNMCGNLMELGPLHYLDFVRGLHRRSNGEREDMLRPRPIGVSIFVQRGHAVPVLLHVLVLRLARLIAHRWLGLILTLTPCYSAADLQGCWEQYVRLRTENTMISHPLRHCHPVV